MGTFFKKKLHQKDLHQHLFKKKLHQTLMERIREVNNGVILEIKVKTNSPESKLYKKDSQLILEIQSPPENNKANMEIMKELGRLFNSQVKILSGFKSKNKVLLIKSLKKADFEKQVETMA